MYIPMGMREPIAMAAVVFALSKSRSFVMLGTMFWYMREDRSKGTADPTADANPPGFVPGARKVPTGSETLAMLGIRRAAKLENTTMTTAFAILSRPALLWVAANREMIAAKATVPTTGSRPHPGRVSASREPAATAPYARKQPLLSRLARGVGPQGRVDEILEAARHLALGRLVKADGHVRQEEARDEVVNVQAW